MGGTEHIVKAAKQGGTGLEHPVLVHTEELPGQGALLDAMMKVQPRLGAPADVEGGVDVGAAPRHNFAQLRPVVHLVELQIFHWSAGDDHSVEVTVPYLVKGGIKGGQVVLVGVLGLVAGRAQQFHLDLYRRIGQLAQDLSFRHDLSGH